MRRRLSKLLLALGALGVVAGQLLPVRAGGTPALEIHKVDSVSFTPGPDKPIFMLALGLDGGRPGIDGDRSDAIHLIGINPATHSGTMLNIPRDSYVAIPGHGQRKINDAYALGGPGLAASTVEALTGADVSFVLGTRFGPFEQMVNDAGGVDVDVPLAMKDRFSGADFPQGRVHMNGSQALSFARNRHIDGGDLRRSEDQGLLILSALTKLRAENLGPTGTARYLAILGKYVGMTGVSPVELYRLGRLALSVDPAAVRSVTMPSRIGSVGPQSVVFVGAGAVSLFEDMRDDAVLQRH